MVVDSVNDDSGVSPHHAADHTICPPPTDEIFYSQATSLPEIIAHKKMHPPSTATKIETHERLSSLDTSGYNIFCELDHF